MGVPARHAWYLYYVPLLLMPLFLFYISLLVAPTEHRRIRLVRGLTLSLAAYLLGANPNK